jgi:hypothetical protein
LHPNAPARVQGIRLDLTKGKEVIGVKGGKETLAMRLNFIIHAKEVKTVLDG